jgi:Tfp pilus assembly protein PilF
MILVRNRRHKDAIEELKHVIRLDPRRARAFIGLATCYRELNLYDEALSEYAKAFSLQPVWVTLGNLNHEYGFALAMRGNYSGAQDVFLKAAAKPELEDRALRSIALLDMLLGKFEAARPRLERAVHLTERAPFSRARHHLYLAMLMRGKGDRAAQIRELDSASKVVDTWSENYIWLQSRIGAGYARAGAVAKAKLILDKLAPQVDPDDLATVADVNVLESELALAQKNYALAIEKLQAREPSVAFPLQWATLARAYQQAGDLVHAAAAYRKLIELRGASLGWEPQQDWLEAHVALAEIYLKTGETARVQPALGEVVHLLKDADRDLPLLKRMKSLTAR